MEKHQKIAEQQVLRDTKQRCQQVWQHQLAQLGKQPDLGAILAIEARVLEDLALPLQWATTEKAAAIADLDNLWDTQGLNALVRALAEAKRHDWAFWQPQHHQLHKQLTQFNTKPLRFGKAVSKAL